MSNKKTKPVAGKSVAGKSDYNKKTKSDRERQKQRIAAQKYGKRILEEKQKTQRERERRSAEIQRNRAKAAESERRISEKVRSKKLRKDKRESFFASLQAKVKYYTSKEFLGSFNYARIFVFIVLPLALIITAGVHFSRSVVVNVPTEIRAYEFNGRLESDSLARESAFNLQQQGVFIDSLSSVGSGKFDFYINSVITLDDNFATDELCFGNPQDGVVLIATIYDNDGTILYRSLGLPGRTELNSAIFFSELEYGTHEVKVSVNAYDKATNERIGTRYAKIKLAVGVDYNGEKID